jgi:hypothetical protein
MPLEGGLLTLSFLRSYDAVFDLHDARQKVTRSKHLPLTGQKSR